MKAITVIIATNEYLHICNKIKIMDYFQKKKITIVAKLLGFYKPVLVIVFSLLGKGI